MYILTVKNIVYNLFIKEIKWTKDYTFWKLKTLHSFGLLGQAIKKKSIKINKEFLKEKTESKLCNRYAWYQIKFGMNDNNC